ncbi:unannotated protein [freshwater metagenome]|uniref:Unannotated protein n=1 Tax=freshwater metagenome TaxID=449393 RepID=A0A6J7GH33_9ZZZZ|nr:integration host factor MihF [Actinomycetota bacterium]
MSPPTLSVEQRRVAGERALAARRVRAEVRVALKSRELSLTMLLARSEDDPALARMKVIEALESLPAIGPTKAQAIMTRLGISPSRRLKGLGTHQRAALLKAFA